MVDLFRPTSVSYAFTPTISYLEGIAVGVVPISNSPIPTNSIFWKIQQYATFTLVMGGIVDFLRPISTSTLNINPCYPISRRKVTGLLWPRFTYINIPSAITRVIVDGQTLPTSMTSVITWGRLVVLLRPMPTTLTTCTITWVIVYGIKIPMSTTFLSQRHISTLFLGTFIVIVTTVGIRMAGLKRPRS